MLQSPTFGIFLMTYAQSYAFEKRIAPEHAGNILCKLEVCVQLAYTLFTDFFNLLQT